MAVHLMLLVKKAEHISTEEFHKYWVRANHKYHAYSPHADRNQSTTHADLFNSLSIVAEKVRKYSQFHVSSTIHDQLKGSGIPIPGFDGVAEIWADSVEDLMAILQDPEYKEKVAPDVAKFADPETRMLMIGSDVLKTVDGKAV